MTTITPCVPILDHFTAAIAAIEYWRLLDIRFHAEALAHLERLHAVAYEIELLEEIDGRICCSVYRSNLLCPAVRDDGSSNHSEGATKAVKKWQVTRVLDDGTRAVQVLETWVREPELVVQQAITLGRWK